MTREKLPCQDQQRSDFHVLRVFRLCMLGMGLMGYKERCIFISVKYM